MEEKIQIPGLFLDIQNKILKKFPDSIEETKYSFNEFTIRVKSDFFIPIAQFIKEDKDLQFDYLTDITAIDYTDREKRFDLVYHLCSIKYHHRLRIKVSIGAGERASSLTKIWNAADWLEREVYDMFGIVFEGHPDLRRILLSEDWKAHPLLKEYPLSGDGN
ncbi:MAG: NADH-quinone oxidoreductase subunit C [candidate division WOR-3 bacterium]